VILLDITLRIRAEGVLRPFLYLIESEGRPSLRAKVRIVFFFSFFLLFFFYFFVFFLFSSSFPPAFPLCFKRNTTDTSR